MECRTRILTPSVTSEAPSVFARGIVIDRDTKTGVLRIPREGFSSREVDFCAISRSSFMQDGGISGRVGVQKSPCVHERNPRKSA
jgi:hypothetical protein